MEKQLSRNAVIEKFLKGTDVTTDKIVEEVHKFFPTVPASTIKRHVYSRRNSLKSAK